MVQTRRRGAELEEAILLACWNQLLKNGYQDLTVEAVAEEAQTGKAAIYRRWKTKEGLVLATLRCRSERVRMTIPETGSLRGDVLEMLRNMNHRYAKLLPALFSVLLASYFDPSRLTPSQVHAYILGNRPMIMRAIITHAMERGEIHAMPPQRIIELPYTLIRHEFLMNLSQIDDDVIVDLIDTVFMPLIRNY
ncbi:TetR/AcrR family transcriptional regulator [Bifidobacterium aquikefiricola]|uniref:TetR/AcrR family transcriptional regulator n=1 Tax=Bifidobacterium aquikefiricola TaxID=3059038 RepID=A0AB39U817_9BIFI